MCTHQGDETAAFDAHGERKDLEELKTRCDSNGVECEEAGEQDRVVKKRGESREENSSNVYTLRNRMEGVEDGTATRDAIQNAQNSGHQNGNHVQAEDRALA